MTAIGSSIRVAFVVMAVSAAIGSRAWAIAPVIFNTGVDAAGVALSNGSSDPHYAVSPGGSGAVDNSISPTPAADGISSWIEPPVNVGPGTYRYSTNFNWPTNDTVTITGQWAAYISAFDIQINGVSGGPNTIPQPSDLQWHAFTASAPVHAGSNELAFTVARDFGSPSPPTGLRAEIFSVVPEPGSFALMAAGSLVMLARRRRR